MFIDIWMLAILVAAFGACAYFSWSHGFYNGVGATIQQLLDDEIIDIVNEQVVKKVVDKPDMI